ncbi:MAG: rhodanese-like domain-containing protein [Flavobacteriales bacterium]|nr:rhodanese-like domain-containing protein [Flavobacteriales bacterium]
MGIFSNIFGTGSDSSAQIKELLAQGALIIDVRSPEEYREGHITKSVNIPLNRIPDKVTELKRKNKPIITCCRSGARSGMAADQLRAAGIEVVNGGPWNSLESQMA